MFQKALPFPHRISLLANQSECRFHAQATENHNTRLHFSPSDKSSLINIDSRHSHSLHSLKHTPVPLPLFIQTWRVLWTTNRFLFELCRRRRLQKSAETPRENMRLEEERGSNRGRQKGQEGIDPISFGALTVSADWKWTSVCPGSRRILQTPFFLRSVRTRCPHRPRCLLPQGFTKRLTPFADPF